jgi:hypothetical protein
MFFTKSKRKSSIANRILYTTEFEFVSDRMSYIVMRGCWCHIILWNVHAQVGRKVMIQRQYL